MAQSDDPNKKFHFNQLTKSKKSLFFKEILKHPTKVELWIEGMESDSLETFEIQHKSSDEQHFEVKKLGGFLKRFLISKLINKKVFIRIREGKVLYFLTGYLELIEADRYQLKNLSNVIFSSQRRQNYRLKIRNNIQGYIVIENLKFPLRDISARGLAFFSSPKVANYFVKNPVVKDVWIILNKQSFHIDEARLIRTKSKKETENISLSFHLTSTKEEESLMVHINDIAREERVYQKYIQHKTG